MLDKLIQTALSAARRQMKRPVLLMVIDPKKDGSFQITFDCEAMTRPHVEACAVDLLQTLSDDMEGTDCECCRARRLRMLSALAILRPDVVVPPGIH